MNRSGDPIENILRHRGRLNRENYLAMNYMGHPLALDPEQEQLLPEDLQGPDDPPKGQHPVNAILSNYPLTNFYSVHLLHWWLAK
jgi:hypothetical protein